MFCDRSRAARRTRFFFCPRGGAGSATRVAIVCTFSLSSVVEQQEGPQRLWSHLNGRTHPVTVQARNWSSANRNGKLEVGAGVTAGLRVAVRKRIGAGC